MLVNCPYVCLAMLVDWVFDMYVLFDLLATVALNRQPLQMISSGFHLYIVEIRFWTVSMTYIYLQWNLSGTKRAGSTCYIDTGPINPDHLCNRPDTHLMYSTDLNSQYIAGCFCSELATCQATTKIVWSCSLLLDSDFLLKSWYWWV